LEHAERYYHSLPPEALYAPHISLSALGSMRVMLGEVFDSALIQAVTDGSVDDFFWVPLALEHFRREYDSGIRVIRLCPRTEAIFPAGEMTKDVLSDYLSGQGRELVVPSEPIALFRPDIAYHSGPKPVNHWFTGSASDFHRCNLVSIHEAGLRVGRHVVIGRRRLVDLLFYDGMPGWVLDAWYEVVLHMRGIGKEFDSQSVFENHLLSLHTPEILPDCVQSITGEFTMNRRPVDSDFLDPPFPAYGSITAFDWFSPCTKNKPAAIYTRDHFRTLPYPPKFHCTKVEPHYVNSIKIDHTFGAWTRLARSQPQVLTGESCFKALTILWSTDLTSLRSYPIMALVKAAAESFTTRDSVEVICYNGESCLEVTFNGYTSYLPGFSIDSLPEAMAFEMACLAPLLNMLRACSRSDMIERSMLWSSRGFDWMDGLLRYVVFEMSRSPWAWNPSRFFRPPDRIASVGLWAPVSLTPNFKLALTLLAKYANVPGEIAYRNAISDPRKRLGLTKTAQQLFKGSPSDTRELRSLRVTGFVESDLAPYVISDLPLTCPLLVSFNIPSHAMVGMDLLEVTHGDEPTISSCPLQVWRRGGGSSFPWSTLEYCRPTTTLKTLRARCPTLVKVFPGGKIKALRRWLRNRRYFELCIVAVECDPTPGGAVAWFNHIFDFISMCPNSTAAGTGLWILGYGLNRGLVDDETGMCDLDVKKIRRGVLRVPALLWSEPDPAKMIFDISQDIGQKIDVDSQFATLLPPLSYEVTEISPLDTRVPQKAIAPFLLGPSWAQYERILSKACFGRGVVLAPPFSGYQSFADLLGSPNVIVHQSSFDQESPLHDLFATAGSHLVFLSPYLPSVEWISEAIPTVVVIPKTHDHMTWFHTEGGDTSWTKVKIYTRGLARAAQLHSLAVFSTFEEGIDFLRSL
jgi:hypothetical protein